MKRNARKKLLSGAYLFTVFALSVALLAMLLLTVSKFDMKFSLRDPRQQLSPRAVSIIEGLSGDICCHVILPKNNLVFHPLENLLESIREVANANPGTSFVIDYINPNSDLARAATEAGRHRANGFCVIFTKGERTEIIPYEALVETVERSSYELVKSAPARSRFRGEQVCVTALARLAAPKTPVIYALSGHGERDFASYDALTGYSDLAREIIREGYEIRSLVLNDDPVPEDCDLLFVAGAQRPPTEHEESAIRDYIGHGGLIMILADTAATLPTGWERVFERIGLKPTNLTAVSENTLGGYNLLVDRFGNHPVAGGLENSALYFVDPQIFDPAGNGPDGPALTVSTVVAAPKDAYGETTPDALPRHYDPGIDREGPLPLALAVETEGREDLGIKAMRAFVIGDSAFASNAMMDGGLTANRDFLLNAVNWLTDNPRATALSLPAEGSALRLAISRNKQIRFWVLSVVGWPVCAVLFGLVMRTVRKFTT